MVKSEQLLPAGQPVDVVVRRGDRLIRLTLTPVDRWRVGDKKEDPGLAEANRAFAMGKLTDAEQGYRAILGRDRNNAGAAVAWNNLGVINHLQDRLEAATWAYREAIRLAPKVALYHLNLGTCFSRIGNLQRAREELAAALGLDPECQGARFLLGRAEALMGDFDSAIQQARLLEAGPDAGAGAGAAGAGGQGAPVDAELRRRRSQGYFLEGEILRIQGNLDASESWYLKAAAEDPYYVDPPTALGAIHYDRGESDEAERWLGKALALDPSSLRALNRMGLLLTKTGDLERAEQMLRKAARLYPDSSIVQSNLGRVYLKKGALGLARAAFRRGVDLAPETTLSHELLAIGLEASGQFAEAKREYELALRFDPAYQEGYRRLASLHRRLGEVTLAESVLGRARHYTQ
jgi:tetratricopeptide (TPR) repeat protein